MNTLNECSQDSVDLKEIRQYLELSQSEFAQQIGISQGVVSLMEKGKVEVSDNIIEKISKAFLSAEDLVE